jgi:hypothetical protein
MWFFPLDPSLQERNIVTLKIVNCVQCGWAGAHTHIHEEVDFVVADFRHVRTVSKAHHGLITYVATFDWNFKTTKYFNAWNLISSILFILIRYFTWLALSLHKSLINVGRYIPFNHLHNWISFLPILWHLCMERYKFLSGAMPLN